LHTHIESVHRAHLPLPPYPRQESRHVACFHSTLPDWFSRSVDISEWKWADIGCNRLVWAEHGQLRTAKLGEGKLEWERLLCDFNKMALEALPAPY